MVSKAGISSARANDTLAHEIAHVLTNYNAIQNPDPADPAHSLDAWNLLAAGSSRILPDGPPIPQSEIGIDRDIITPGQAVMFNSGAIQGVPEPSVLVLTFSGLALAGSRRLRRAA